MISVIIPAYNEENVIGRTIDALLSGKHADEIEVIVVCNGCKDETVNIVSSYGERVKRLETPVASKTNALNLGDKTANYFPRVYLDADVVFTSDSVRILTSLLQQGVALAASPKMKMDCTESSWFVKSYYDIWQQLTYVKEGMIGTGVFGLSKAGRERFGKFPDIIADDGFVRAMFKKEERVSVANCYSIVCSPLDIAGLLKIKTRSRLGRYELAQRFPELLGNEEKKYGSALISVLQKMGNWPKLPIYLYVNLITRIRAQRHFKRMGYVGWERDETSRRQKRE